MPNLVVGSNYTSVCIRRENGSLTHRPSVSLKVIGTDTDRLATCNILLVIHSYPLRSYLIGPTVSEINGDFGRKSQILPTPVYLKSSLRFPCNFVTAVRLKKLT